MRWYKDIAIIGIDSGYGNIKTANCCFTTGVSEYPSEPVFKDNLLEWDGRYFLIGEEHKEFLADKTADDDYYVLALAAIARELNIQKLYSAKVWIAAGLPLTWVSGQRDDFKAYLLKNREVSYSFRGKEYHVEIVGAEIFPQGFAAVCDKLASMKGTNMIADIGNGTMNVMFVIDRKPVVDNMFTEKFGTHQCVLAAKENVMREHHVVIPERTITEVLRFGTADIHPGILKTIQTTATEYVKDLFKILRDHEYNADLMRLHIIGGGGCLIRNFGDYDHDRVTIIEDICATAKGYETLSERNFRKAGAAK